MLAVVRANYWTFSASLMIAFCNAITTEFAEHVSINTRISRHIHGSKLNVNETDLSDIGR
jgi:hypothetical protein